MQPGAALSGVTVSAVYLADELVAAGLQIHPRSDRGGVLALADQIYPQPAACRRRDVLVDLGEIVRVRDHEIEVAVQAMKNGAYHYITKDFDYDELRSLVRNACERCCAAACLFWMLLVPEELRVGARIDDGGAVADFDAVIEEVVVDGRVAGGSRPFATSGSAALAAVTVPPGSRRLEVHYAALSFSAPDKLRFRYMLEGLDSSWLDVGNRRVAYLPELAPGSYRFRVQADTLPGEYRYRLLLVQSGQRVKEFQGALQFVVNLEQGDRKFVLSLPPEDQKNAREYQVSFKVFQRVEGTFKVAPGTVVKSLQVRVFESGANAPKLSQTVSVS